MAVSRATLLGYLKLKIRAAHTAKSTRDLAALAALHKLVARLSAEDVLKLT